MAKKKEAIFKSLDPREIPTYTLSEAAQYLRIPRTTIRDWVTGRSLQKETITRRSQPIIPVPKSTPRLLSFINLVEVHILDAIRREHNISLEKVRKAIQYLQRQSPSKHPLVDHTFETNGMNLFIEKYEQLINVTQEGQLAIKEIMKAHLKRIERDAQGIPQKLYPFTHKRAFRPGEIEPTTVVIDPRVSFGRPSIIGTGIPTSIIAERYKAGESVEDLADDYGLQSLQIQEAIRSELTLEAA
ncbi:MAG: DUF433 domain-containing protein [Nitrospirales bacterium]